MKEVITNKIKDCVIELANENIITSEDKELISGLNSNNNMKHSPEYQSVDPHVEPLFKIHKMSTDEIRNKTIPPMRLVSAAHNGPLYRLEKWMSPHLTSLSQTYLSNEYLKDTSHLTSNIDDVNQNLKSQTNMSELYLFTLDVVQLYPSINPELCKTAIQHAFDTCLDQHDVSKLAMTKFLDMILDLPYIHYKGMDYKSVSGIPTGGCTSRQEADIFMHWILYQHAFPNLQDSAESVIYWKRYIDEIFGIWKGTREQFNIFMQRLNGITKGFGITFDGEQFGSSVSFLDVTLFFDDNNLIQHRLYTKPTDSRRYLNTSSFHDPAVFKSVPLSQLLRVMNRNLVLDLRANDIEKLKTDLQRSGYKASQLETATSNAENRFNEDKHQRGDTDQRDPIILSTLYFKNSNELRNLLHQLTDDIRIVTGNSEINPILENIRGKNLKELVSGKNKFQNPPNANAPLSLNQKCNTPGCKTCCLMKDAMTPAKTANYSHKLPSGLNCKSNNIIYFAQCSQCMNVEGSYVGQTQQPFHKRVNNHRHMFHKAPDKSPLAYHSLKAHSGTLNFDDFTFYILHQSKGTNLNRLESMYIDKFRCRTLGLNSSSILAT